MDFHFVHLYSDVHVESEIVAGEIAKIFPSCEVDIRGSFKHDNRVELARISNMKQPFEKQSEQAMDDMMPLYDGFVLQRILAEMIPFSESSHVHIIVTGLLTCTFSEDDWRYHGRAVICGSPSIISTAGIVEAPARPREYYLPQLEDITDIGSLKTHLSGKFINYGERRVISAVKAYALQALFFFITSGEPFCKNKKCSLYDAHWQEELIAMIEKGGLCSHHWQMASLFNKRSANP